MPASVGLEIGGVVFRASTTSTSYEFEATGAYKQFVTDAPPDVTVEVLYGNLPDIERDNLVFDSGGVWALYHQQEQWVISVQSPSWGDEPYLLAVFEEDFSAGKTYIQTKKASVHPLPFPLGHPLSEVLMINLLARERGALLHACGVVKEGRGYLFVGVSGAGKSTMANLWQDRGTATVLSDDRIIVRHQDGKIWAYGTPWHGDAHLVSKEVVPVERIFFIRHASSNSILPLKPAEIVSRLLVRSFPTFWDTEGMNYTLGFMEELSQTVSCAELGFVPDQTALDFVECIV